MGIEDTFLSATIHVKSLPKNGDIKQELRLVMYGLYKRATVIVCVTNSYKKDLINLGIDENKIVVVENGINMEKLFILIIWTLKIIGQIVLPIFCVVNGLLTIILV